MIDTSTTQIGSDYISHTSPKVYTITLEIVAHHITCETTTMILGYRDLVKIDSPVWKNSMCNELGRLYQGWRLEGSHQRKEKRKLQINRER